MLGRLFHYLDRTVEAVVALIFFVMVVVGGLQVFCRYALNSPLSWSEELQILCNIWLVFLTIPVAYNRAMHIGMEILLQRMPRPAQKVLVFVLDLMWLTLGVALVYLSAIYKTPIGKTFLQLAARNTSASLQLKYSHIYLCIVIGGTYLILVALRKVAGHFSGKQPAPAA